MKKRRDIVEVVKSWCVIIGTTLCYIVLSLINVYFYHHVAPLEPPSGEVDLAKVIIEVLSNSITIAAGATDGLVAFLLGCGKKEILEMSRNVQSGNTQNLKSTVIQRSFPKWSVAERRKTAAASNQAAVCACAHSRYFTGGSPSGLRV